MDQHESPMEHDVRVRYEWSSTNPSTAVVETVAAATGRDPMTFEPLYERVDPDALDALVRPTGSNPAAGDVTVSFSFAERTVTIRQDGEVVVRADRSE